MKAKFLLFVVDCLTSSKYVFLAHEMISARQIRLKNKTEAQHRSSSPVTPAAFIENSLLSIDLLSTVPTVTVIIKNAETDVVYTSTDLNVDKVYIDFTGEEKGKYTLEIQLQRRPLLEILN